MDKTKVALMTAAELEAHIKALDKDHRELMKHLRALLRVVRDQEGGDE